jgi:hypothetical protein
MLPLLPPVSETAIILTEQADEKNPAGGIIGMNRLWNMPGFIV